MLGLGLSLGPLVDGFRVTGVGGGGEGLLNGLVLGLNLKPEGGCSRGVGFGI